MKGPSRGNKSGNVHLSTEHEARLLGLNSGDNSVLRLPDLRCHLCCGWEGSSPAEKSSLLSTSVSSRTVSDTSSRGRGSTDVTPLHYDGPLCSGGPKVRSQGRRRGLLPTYLNPHYYTPFLPRGEVFSCRVRLHITPLKVNQTSSDGHESCLLNLNFSGSRTGVHQVFSTHVGRDHLKTRSLHGSIAPTPLHDLCSPRTRGFFKGDPQSSGSRRVVSFLRD